MLPRDPRLVRHAHPTRTAVDAKLMERSGLDEFSLRRLRTEFLHRCQRMSYMDRRTMAEGGACPRFRFMVELVCDLWSEERWETWLRYLEHGQRDIDEMCRGEYPISPYLVRVFSALFGIKVDFLLLGAPPTVDKLGANIDVWPLIATQ